MLYELTILLAAFPLTWMAVTDLQDARIDNRAVVLLIAVGVATTGLAPDPLLHVAAAALTFLSTFFLWQTDNLGGGDVKMLTAVALILGPLFPWFLVAFGLAAAVVAASRTLLLSRIWQRGERARMIPMGVAAMPAFLLVSAWGIA